MTYIYILENSLKKICLVKYPVFKPKKTKINFVPTTH